MCHYASASDKHKGQGEKTDEDLRFENMIKEAWNKTVVPLSEIFSTKGPEYLRNPTDYQNWCEELESERAKLSTIAKHQATAMQLARDASEKVSKLLRLQQIFEKVEQYVQAQLADLERGSVLANDILNAYKAAKEKAALDQQEPASSIYAGSVDRFIRTLGMHIEKLVINKKDKLNNLASNGSHVMQTFLKGLKALEKEMDEMASKRDEIQKVTIDEIVAKMQEIETKIRDDNKPKCAWDFVQSVEGAFNNLVKAQKSKIADKEEIQKKREFKEGEVFTQVSSMWNKPGSETTNLCKVCVILEQSLEYQPIGEASSSEFSELLEKTPSSKGLSEKAPSSKGLLEKAPSSKGLLEKAPSSKGLLEKAPSSKGLLKKAPSSKGLLEKAPSSKGLLEKAPSSKAHGDKSSPDDVRLQKLISKPLFKMVANTELDKMSQFDHQHHRANEGASKIFFGGSVARYCILLADFSRAVGDALALLNRLRAAQSQLQGKCSSWDAWVEPLHSVLELPAVVYLFQSLQEMHEKMKDPVSVLCNKGHTQVATFSPSSQNFEGSLWPRDAMGTLQLMSDLCAK